MSRSQRLSRSSLSSIRSLSDSENEENDISTRLRSRRNGSLNTGVTPYTERQREVLESRTNNHNVSNSRTSSNDIYSLMNNHSHSYLTADSAVTEGAHMPELPALVVQYTPLDRFLWKHIYLMIIRMVNFDVWSLSRLNKWGKCKVVLIFLIPLLLYLIWSLVSNESHIHERPIDWYTSLSSVIMYFSSMLSSVMSNFVQKEDFIITTTEEELCHPIVSGVSTVFSSLSGISGLFSNIFMKSKESASFTTKSDDQSFEPVPESSEEIRLVVAQVLKEEIKTVLNNLEVKSSESDKKEKKKIENELKNLHIAIQSLTETMAGLEKNLESHIKKSPTTEDVASLTVEYNTHRELLNSKLKDIEQKFQSLESVKDCCDKKWNPSEFFASFETHLAAAFRNVMDGDKNKSTPYYFFYKWLNTKYKNKDLSKEMAVAFEKLKAGEKTDKMEHHDVIKVAETVILKYIESIKANLSHLSNEADLGREVPSVEQIKKVVKEAILLYDADKTGLVDYALESGGGSVLGTRCSETYVEKHGKYTLFGLSIWPSYNSPRTAIQPEVHPGQCWAFKGSQGFLVLELSATIYPTGFTLEHIPVSLSPSGSIDSAPNVFSVWGLTSEKDTEGILLGRYSYDVTGEPLQYFPVKSVINKPFSLMELKIHSNHGNMEYTCLYRFRVHGTRVK